MKFHSEIGIPVSRQYQGEVFMKSPAKPRDVDWSIIDGQGEKKTCFLTQVNQVNGSLSTGSGLPNGTSVRGGWERPRLTPPPLDPNSPQPRNHPPSCGCVG